MTNKEPIIKYYKTCSPEDFFKALKSERYE